MMSLLWSRISLPSKGTVAPSDRGKTLRELVYDILCYNCQADNVGLGVHYTRIPKLMEQCGYSFRPLLIDPARTVEATLSQLKKDGLVENYVGYWRPVENRPSWLATLLAKLMAMLRIRR